MSNILTITAKAGETNLARLDILIKYLDDKEIFSKAVETFFKKIQTNIEIMKGE